MQVEFLSVELWDEYQRVLDMFSRKSCVVLKLRIWERGERRDRQREREREREIER